jgi:hypothetical protein
MNELEPYDRRSPPLIPLSGGARFVRGFGRVGLVVAILIGIGGAITTYFIAQEQELSPNLGDERGQAAAA